MTLWAGKAQDAESTLLPKVRSWLRTMAMEHGNTPEDHMVVIWCNCPALGILSASRVSFLLNLVTNVLSDFGLNGVCFLIHPNRASNNADGRLELRDSIYSIIHPIHHPDSPNTLSP